jgi:lipoic acid synthetase
MIGGDTCTRSCKFCNVKTGRPAPIDSGEIGRIVESVRSLGLRHAVITSVDRDDLPDGGASHWAALIRALHAECPGVTMEVLVPDFRGNTEALDMIIAERPNVISHNLETVRRLTPDVRCTATYDGSLAVIARVAAAGIRSKSGIMLGLGETPQEVEQTMDDLRGVGCEVMTIGQYLQPTENHYEVREYIHPDQFERYRLMALAKGFRHVESSPLVRSSYHAERHVL